jgi:hypothetical protein
MVESYVVVIAPDLEEWLAADPENATRDGVRVGQTLVGVIVAALTAGSLVGSTYVHAAGITWPRSDEILGEGYDSHDQVAYAFMRADRIEGILDRYAIAGYLGLHVNFFNVHGRCIFVIEMIVDILTGEVATTTYYVPPG